jgi:hypothetical protein
MYTNGANKGRNAPSAMQRDASAQKASRASASPNNVYADKNGNVARQQQNGNWQSRDNGSWKNTPSSNNNLNRDAQARQSGASRPSSSYGGSRGGYSGGGSRGGGGGRRR